MRLAPEEVAPTAAVGDLVAAVLPDLAEEDAVRLFLFHRRADVRDEVVGQLVGDIEPPARRPEPQPVPHDGVLAVHDEFPVRRTLLVHSREGVHAPPRVVAVRPVREAVPRVVGRVLALRRAPLRVEAVGVEVAARAAVVVEHTVEQDADTALFRLAAERAEVLLRPEHRVDGAVIRGVVAVVRCRFKDRAEIERRHAERGEVVELRADARETAAEEVTAAHLACLVGAEGGKLVPVRVDEPVPDHPTRVRHRQTAEPVGEDLIAHAAAKPVRRGACIVVNRQLPAGETVFAPGKAVLPEPEDAPVRAFKPEAVPDQLRRVRCAQCTGEVITVGGERDCVILPGELKPRHELRRGVILPSEQAEGNLSAADRGAEGGFTLEISGIKSHKSPQEMSVFSPMIAVPISSREK